MNRLSVCFFKPSACIHERLTGDRMTEEDGNLSNCATFFISALFSRNSEKTSI